MVGKILNRETIGHYLKPSLTSIAEPPALWPNVSCRVPATISSMRFDSPSNAPPPLAPSWRLILWAISLAPALLILGWSLRQARLPKPDPTTRGRTSEEVQRLQRILKEPSGAATTQLRDDAVRMVATTKVAKPDDSETPATQIGGDDRARLDKSILVGIKDNTFGVTAAEKPAYDAILAKVRHTPVSELERAAHKDVPFAMLMLDADRFRGELLMIEGDIRRLTKLSAPDDTATTDESFEAWLFTADSGLNPYRVVLAQLLKGIPLGDDLQPPVRVRITGYFFKRYSYATANAFHTAPLLIAPSFELLAHSSPGATARPGNSQGLTFLAMGLLSAFVILGLSVVMSSRSPRRHPQRSQARTDSPPEFFKTTYQTRPSLPSQDDADERQGDR